MQDVERDNPCNMLVGCKDVYSCIYKYELVPSLVTLNFKPSYLANYKQHINL